MTQNNQNSDKHSLVASQDMSQKASHLRSVHSIGESSCIYLRKPASSAPSYSLKCLYSSASYVENQQEDPEICVQLQGHDAITIMETLWDSLNDWNAVMDSSVFF